ncbi:hypothetical protein KR026_003668, partial [Drosophila bipectinata]
KMESKINGKQLIMKMQSINEPVTFETLVKAFNFKPKSGKVFQESTQRLRNVLSASIRLGFVKEYNKHYFTSTHMDEMTEFMEEEFEKDDAYSKKRLMDAKDDFEDSDSDDSV